MKRVILFCLVIGLLFSGCSSGNKSSSKSISINGPSTDTVFIMGGKIATDDSIDVSSNITGKVVEVSADLGKKVKAGDVVARLDTTELQSKVDEAQSAVSTAQTGLSNAQSSKNSNSSDISGYQSQLSQAQSQLKASQEALDAAVIKAPISGTVSSRNANIGDTITEGESIISIVNTDNLYVNAYAPARILNQINVGQSVAVKIPDISDDEFSGRIAVINSKLDPRSSDVLVKVTLNNKNKLLKPGMFAEVGLQ
ncbi:efflux RND transporter periplasmic adaptor subunit [Clostridium sp. HV4-5-A1G]|uniref:efflux RND transporter periplasmic adaptor subunit n=1 Tax=Clostridium sp. HV4-5-A1G TaxID=2004595 RepID=UPI00123C29E1|nr:efflux RND transporter periplasmic adaptor subunit [Clostridium sp. HV4-5-A1G]KAA8674086.1 efflux RND transporter periplasmic adaptor subunit [Clostridium sp. HV4-5-A1G]